MDEPFVISVIYKNREHHFDAQLFTSAYNYRIQVLVENSDINFERDDSGSFRAIAVTPDDLKNQKIDAGLLQTIADALEEILS